MIDLFCFLRYVLLLWGIVYFFTQSAIMLPWRCAVSLNPFLATLAYCPACFGTWVGFCLFSFFPWQSPHLVITVLESGLAAMSLGRVWQKFFGDPSLFEHEMPRHPWFREGDGQNAEETRGHEQ